MINFKKPDIITETIETLVVSFIVIMGIYGFIAMPEVVWGASMEPNFYTGERILVEKITKHFQEYERGEVVVFHPPGSDDIDYIKRIIGVPGDIVKILDCKIYISRDGSKFELQEDYIYDGICTAGGTKVKAGRSLKIEEGQYLVLGDNRDQSLDSRTFGFIDEERIVGRVVFRFWPPPALGLVP